MAGAEQIMFGAAGQGWDRLGDATGRLDGVHGFGGVDPPTTHLGLVLDALAQMADGARDTVIAQAAWTIDTILAPGGAAVLGDRVEQGLLHLASAAATGAGGAVSVVGGMADGPLAEFAGATLARCGERLVAGWYHLLDGDLFAAGGAVLDAASDCVGAVVWTTSAALFGLATALV